MLIVKKGSHAIRAAMKYFGNIKTISGIVLIFPKNRIHSGSNGMRNIFLLFTQPAQFKF